MDRIYVMKLVRSYQCGGMTRRTFLTRATAALGSVAAANVLLAGCQPISPAPPPVVVEDASADADTDADSNMEGGAALAGATVDYPDSEGNELMGHLAQPEGGEANPAVIVLQEWWGLNDHIKEVADRFAAEGYVALAPDLYHGVVVSEPDEARKLVMELDMPTAVAEIRAAIDYLQSLDSVAGDKVGIVGFCMGGRLTLATAMAEEDLGAAVAFYGTPIEPEQASEIKAPVLGLYGDQDRGIPVEAVETMGAALDEAGIENEIHIYENAQHAFFNETRESSYNAEASADAWTRTLAWFEKYL